MMRRLFVAVVFSLLAVSTAWAGPIPTYSPSSQPFEAFEWTPLDLAAFDAYGGDFANVRKPVERIRIVEDPFAPTELRGPEDEQDALKAFVAPSSAPPQFYFEELPAAGGRAAFDELPVSGLAAVPEPASAMLVGLGLLGMSARLGRTRRRG